MNYKIRKISDTSKVLLLDFFKVAYPDRYKNLNDHWKWYYRLGYNSFEPIIIEVDSRIIGMAGLIPSKLKFNNKVTEAIWFTDFFVLKEYRDKGYGSILTKEWMKICPTQITFCNNESLRVFKKFAWKSNKETYRNIKPINLFGMVPFIKNLTLNLNKNKSNKTFNPKRIENSDITKLCVLENKKKLNANLFSIVHDEGWFKWRLLNCPYKSNIYLFEINEDVIIGNIFKYKNLKRLNVIYSHISDPNNREIYNLIIDWSLSNKIDFLWYINNQENIFFKEQKILSRLFEKRINFACWSNDEIIFSNLEKGLSNSHGGDSDIDSILFQDQ